jgi:hypothetical protein
MPGTITNRTTRRSDDPANNECLRCYLRRTLEDYGCDGSRRWSVRWYKLRAPLDTQFLERLEDLGGFCDCEILLNTWQEDVSESGGSTPCSGTTHDDPLVPCQVWSPHPETLVRDPDDDYYDDEPSEDAYRGYGDL